MDFSDFRESGGFLSFMENHNYVVGSYDFVKPAM